MLISQSSRRFGWSDFVSAGRWADGRVRALEFQVAPLTIACALSCEGLTPHLRSPAAFASIGVIMLLCRALDEPPPLIAPGRVGRLQEHDARLRRLARHLFTNPFVCVRRAPAFVLSWCFLGLVAAFG
jgi:hypothetical protein